MKIENKTAVAITYELTVDGSVADKATEANPLEYIQGMGMLLPKFESELAGKEPGDSFGFVLTPAEGYGEYNPAYIAEIPKSAFMVDGQMRDDLLQVGLTIPMLNAAGQVCQGVIKEICAETVKMDFNHQMAGKTLNFTGKVISVRKATEKELTEGLHGEFLPPEEHGCHCGGKCHHGEGECEGDCECGGDCHHEDGECCSCK